VDACRGSDLEGSRLSLKRWRAAAGQDWQELTGLASEDASGEVGACPFVLTQRALLIRGETSRAAELETTLRKKAGGKGSAEDMAPGPCALHMEGVRLVFEGEASEAAKRFEAADAQLTYRGAAVGTFKLFNLVNLASALRASGDSKRAAEIVGGARSVNGNFASDLLAGLSLTL
jgi:hypothetical protein